MKWMFWAQALGLLLMAACRPDPSALNQQGNSWYAQGDYDAALRAYQDAQVLAPDRPEAYLNAGNVLALQGDLNRAVEAMQQGAKTDDAVLQSWAFYNLGNHYYQAGQYTPAIEAYKQALIINPNDAWARYNLELALRQTQATLEQTAEPTPRSDATQTPALTPSAEATQEQPAALALTLTPGRMSREQAELLLDALQQAQQPLPEAQTTPDAPVEKDW